MHSEEEQENSIWLFDVLESIGVNDEYRRAWQHTGITCEILRSVEALITSSNYGSSCEATVTQSENDDDQSHDLDYMVCEEWFSVIEDVAKAEKNKFSLLIVREPETPAGYVKLQLVGINKPLISLDWPHVQHLFPNMFHCFKTDTLNRLVLCDFLTIPSGRLANRPAYTHEVYNGLYFDAVFSYRGKTWPSMANEWLTRSRLYGWPSHGMIQDLKSLGFFVVKKVIPFQQNRI
ncbi:unnamed protein product [Mytilus edulis]|uniref:Uncharacterized protein n=1 Tax=Mytilus edulis TaxID=6550 RepID=A0A8S3UML9_MYTED|nr:unnamed protein product [Mytilus edulis]